MLHYLPIALPFFLAFWGLIALVVVLIEIGILRYAFEQMGVHRRYLFTLLVLSLVGSYINIPVAQLPPERVRSGEVIDYFGVQYVLPVIVEQAGPIIAVNVGGAVVPFFLSLYLMVTHGLYRQSLLAVGLVGLVVHLMARPIAGVGIAVPIFIPPLITAVVAVGLARWHAAPLAYIAGSMGTLIGADLLNLGKLRGLGAPVASIGGAGKFDGIFLTGIVAVLLAGIFGIRWRPQDPQFSGNL
jgi:uncharacterized membrane protein